MWCVFTDLTLQQPPNWTVIKLWPSLVCFIPACTAACQCLAPVWQAFSTHGDVTDCARWRRVTHTQKQNLYQRFELSRPPFFLLFWLWCTLLLRKSLDFVMTSADVNGGASEGKQKKRSENELEAETASQPLGLGVHPREIDRSCLFVFRWKWKFFCFFSFCRWKLKNIL